MVNAMRLIVDSDGSVWSAYDEKLVERWGYPDPDFDLPSFAIRNLGAIDIRVEEQEVTISFRWLTVKSDALISASQVLSQLPPRAVIVRCETSSWTDHSFADPESAIEWINANRALWLGANARSVVTSPRKLTALSDRSLSRIEDSDDRLALMFKKWRMSQGRFSDEIPAFLVRFGLLDRTAVARDSTPGDLVWEHFGTRITLYNRTNPDWSYFVAGRPVADQPDQEYGRYASGIFRDILDRRQPTFDHIDAVVRDGSEAARFRYDRLLLPWESSNDTRIITSLSFKTDPDTVVAA